MQVGDPSQVNLKQASRMIPAGTFQLAATVEEVGRLFRSDEVGRGSRGGGRSTTSFQ
jgi:hypothetical protein